MQLQPGSVYGNLKLESSDTRHLQGDTPLSDHLENSGYIFSIHSGQRLRLTSASLCAER